MKNAMRQIKLLLLILTLGVWGLVAQHFFTSSVFSATPGKRIYVATSDKEGKIYFDHSAGDNLAFTGSGLFNVLSEAIKQNVRVHSIMSPSSGGGYVIFVER